MGEETTMTREEWLCILHELTGIFERYGIRLRQPRPPQPHPFSSYLRDFRDFVGLELEEPKKRPAPPPAAALTEEQLNDLTLECAVCLARHGFKLKYNEFFNSLRGGLLDGLIAHGVKVSRPAGHTKWLELTTKYPELS